MSVEGSLTGDLFLAFVRSWLLPLLKPGQVVVMDNLSVHKVAGVRSSLEAAGVRLLYLPPYSPDFSPIEKMWFKLKTYLRSQAARTRQALLSALSSAFDQITPKDTRAWFHHCGYVAQETCNPLYYYNETCKSCFEPYLRGKARSRGVGDER